MRFEMVMGLLYHQQVQNKQKPWAIPAIFTGLECLQRSLCCWSDWMTFISPRGDFWKSSTDSLGWQYCSDIWKKLICLYVGIHSNNKCCMFGLIGTQSGLNEFCKKKTSSFATALFSVISVWYQLSCLEPTGNVRSFKPHRSRSADILWSFPTK